MEATVIETFHGVDFSVIYEEGKVYDFDEERFASLTQRGLIKGLAKPTEQVETMDKKNFPEEKEMKSTSKRTRKA